MLYKSGIAWLCFILLVNSSCGQISSSNPDQSTEKKATILKDLKKADEGNINLSRPINIDSDKPPIYNEDLTQLKREAIIQMLSSGEFVPEAYVDKNNEIQLYVLRKLTPEEKKLLENFRPQNSLVGQPAFNFRATDMAGRQYALEELKGKVVVINFWFVECKPCVMEIPELNKLVQEFKDKEVVFLGIATSDKEKITGFLKETSFLYNIIPDSRNLADLYKTRAFPSHFIIDKNSIIVHHTIGLSPNTVSDLEKKIKSLLNETK